MKGVTAKGERICGVAGGSGQVGKPLVGHQIWLSEGHRKRWPKWDSHRRMDRGGVQKRGLPKEVRESLEIRRR